MKSKITLLAAFLMGGFLSAQTPFGHNATWYYTFSEYGYTGYKKITYEKDTTLSGDVWQKFEVTGLKQIIYGPGPNDISQHPNARFNPIFLRTINDSVFYRMNNHPPQLLYDFNAGVGDSWQFAPLSTGLGCMDTPVATVVAIGYDTIKGVPVKYWEIENQMDTIYVGGTPHYYCSSGFCLHEKIYKDFGTTFYNSLFFPTPNICNGGSFQLSMHSMRCFSNDSIEIKLMNKCDHWSLIGLDELEKTPFKLYPNPTSSRLTIEGKPMAEITLADMTGRTVAHHKLNGNSQAELQLTLAEGIYLVKVIFSDGTHKTEKLRVGL